MIGKVFAADVTVSKWEGNFSEIAGNILTNTIFPFLGAIALGAVIYSGVLFIMSRGEPDKLSQAKRALLYSVIGVILVVLSYTLVLAFKAVITNQIL